MYLLRLSRGSNEPYNVLKGKPADENSLSDLEKVFLLWFNMTMMMTMMTMVMAMMMILMIR